MNPLIIPLILLVLSSVFFYASYYLKVKYQRLELSGRKTTARIIDQKKKIEKNNDGSRSTMYYPIIQFTNGVQQTVKEQLNVGRSWKWKLEPIQIYYLETDTDHYEIVINNKFWRTYFPMIFTIGGAIIIAVALWMLWESFI